MFRKLSCIAGVVLAIGACEGSGCGPDRSAGAEPTASATATTTAAFPQLAPDPREKTLARAVSGILSTQHIRNRPVDDALSRQAFDEYVDRLDGRKLFLLAKQVEALRAMADQMDDQLEDGDLVLARRGEALLLKREKKVAQLVAELLEAPFDFSDDEQIQTDPDELTFAKDEKALGERWRKLLELQVLQRIAAMETVEKARADGDDGSDDDEAEDDEDDLDVPDDIPATFEGKEKKARTDLATSYEARFKRRAEHEPLAPVERFLGAVAAVYDPHTTYLAPDDKENFDIEMSGSLEGIGALLGVEDHFVEVQELVPGGASWRQGELEAGDLILAVAPEGQEPVEVTDMPLNRVVELIRGPKGTEVTLRVKKADGRIESITIVRDVIVIEAAYARGAELKLEGEPAMGYVHLPSFYGNTRRERGATGGRNASADVAKLLSIYEQRGLPGVVIDLRGNGGGLLDHARNITGHLIETGPVVQVRASDGSQEVLRDEDASAAYGGQVVVLVDRFSASASEILAGALQDYRRAVVVGTGPTHGKGTVQVLVELDRLRKAPGPPLGVLKVTTQQYFLVDGDSTQSRGVEPDVVLPDPAGYVESGERTLEHAIPWSEVKPLRYEPWKGLSPSVASLVSASEERVADEEVFAAVEKRNEMLEARRADTLVPLERGAWNERRKRLDAELEAVNETIEEGPARFEVTPVDYGGEDDEIEDERIEQRLERWREDLGSDVWLEEALRVLSDMQASGS